MSAFTGNPLYIATENDYCLFISIRYSLCVEEIRHCSHCFQYNFIGQPFVLAFFSSVCFCPHPYGNPLRSRQTD
ncbi:hypothetical protein HU72_18735 [Salmonella enterica subsp. enterica serovar Bere]|nr:hypothetical protein [Salmonella enterica subsp. enterica serovar Bere]ECI0840809.1 hypothetical protein [Salmonella enterica subsp. diarizonae]